MKGIMGLNCIAIATKSKPIGFDIKLVPVVVAIFKLKLKITNRTHCFISQRELFLSEVNNRETIAAIEVNNDTNWLQKQIEKFSLTTQIIYLTISSK